ncbi:MAG: LURP-one-related family protein [Clostridia bacterium]|nr:LURP-one-related family protein [Clostridia bacterium]
MKLLFKQRFFSWFDSYDIYNEAGETVFTVKGRMAWGHKLEISDRSGRAVGMLEEKIFRFLPTFEMYAHGQYAGSIRKEFTFFRPSFTLDMNGWQVEGNWLEWDYTIVDNLGLAVASITKQFGWTDTYVLDVYNDADALSVLMVVLAIDAEKCSRD